MNNLFVLLGMLGCLPLAAWTCVNLLTMIRAILKDGILEPLDPPPAAWRDGRELRGEEAEPLADDLESWHRELEVLVRREMGLLLGERAGLRNHSP